MIDVSNVPSAELLRVIIGAGEQAWPGWIATHQEQLDLLSRDDWRRSFADRLPDRRLREHVWEHLTEAERRQAAKTGIPMTDQYTAPCGATTVTKMKNSDSSP